MRSLIDNASSEWTTNYNGSGKNGRLFTYNGASIFLPALGSRNRSDGSLFLQGSESLSWTANSNDANGGYCLVSTSSEEVYVATSYRSTGQSVRCVQE
jgi:hypothetical protein